MRILREKYFIPVVLLTAFLLIPLRAMAAPVLHFSDITSGPKTGNSDGVGSGAIVTVWGNNLGSSQGSSKVYVGSVEATAIYYWKNADGVLPSGPADLKTYHRMQEIAFAVPAAAVDGPNTIKVKVSSEESNTLAFTIRPGNIKFIKATGTDAPGNGSWNSPLRTLGYAFAGDQVTGTAGRIAAGDIYYSVGVGSTAGLKIGGNNPVLGTASNPISLIAYPNTKVAISGKAYNGFVVFNYYASSYSRMSQYVNLAKLSITANGSEPEPANGIGVNIGNRLVGLEITGPTVYGGYGGAITGTAGKSAGGGKYYGIYIHHYGYANGVPYNEDYRTWTHPPYTSPTSSCTTCTSTDAFQHLYYISNRSPDLVEAYEIGWNHLADNPILHGIHIYDQGTVGGWSGVMKVHDNVIKNQRGGAIDIAYPAGTYATVPLEIYNNIIVSDQDDVYTGGAFRVDKGGPAKVYNNTIYGYGYKNFFNNASTDYRNNVMIDNKGVQFITNNLSLPPNAQSNNLFYSTASTPKPAWATDATGNINADPHFFSAVRGNFALKPSSPAKYKGTDAVISTAPTDFFGKARKPGSVSIGAIEYDIDLVVPPPLENLRVTPIKQ